MEVNPTRICELIVGLGDVEVVGVDDAPGGPLALHIRTRALPACGGCGGPVWSSGTAWWGWWTCRRSGARCPHVAQVAVALPHAGGVADDLADPAAYSQQHAVDDAVAVLDAHSVGEAHVVGISMGGFAGLHLAMQHPGRVRSLVAAGTGYGARPGEVDRFRGECDAIADVIETSGIGAFARQYMSGPSRVQLQNKDPRAWQEYTEWVSEHSAQGSAATMRGVQRGRPSLYALEAELAAITAPVLVLAGDEDDGCLETSVWLKRVIPTAGLAVLAKSGHTLNIEEPDLVNTLIADFLTRVAAGAWGPRDPRADPGAITGFS